MRGQLSQEAALRRLLEGTSLAVRRARSGALIIEPPSTPPLARQDVPVAEILVLGRRTQNADIRRQESDIQPYRVATAAQIRSADRDNLDQYFRSRVPANAAVLPPSLDVNGDVNSDIDLRGLGSSATLVLIDGRRMPSLPASVFGFRQPDLNAVPLHAIDRVEILTGAAGGIHGFGALGGAVNVVLDRDTDGLQLHATGGVTARGDARHLTLEAELGFSPDDGRTDVALYASHSSSEPLRAGDRRYIARDAEITTALFPSQLIGMRPNGDSIFVSSTTGGLSPLTFKPTFGGGSTSSIYSFLPAGSSGVPADVAAAIRANAGTFDTSLSQGEAATDLIGRPRSAAVLGNLRHRLDWGGEAYLDAVMLWQSGRYVGRQTDARLSLPVASPFNPFVQQVQVTFPVPGISLERETRVESRRYTAGLMAPMPFGWRATTEVAVGSAKYKFVRTDLEYQDPFFVPNGPPLNPFGNWDEFQTALLSYRATSLAAQTITNNFRAFSVRLAGPAPAFPNGRSTLTLLAERRIEDVPSYTELSATISQTREAPVAARDSATTSFYAELRSEVFGHMPPTPLMRDLELQAAVRHDSQIDHFSRDPKTPSSSERMRAQFSGTTYTLGAKVSPADWLTVRGSYATGKTPPPLGDLIEAVFTTLSSSGDDPKRGNRPVGASGPFLRKAAGSPDLTVVDAESASVGVILTPWGPPGPLLTLDYSRIRKSGDVYRPSDQVVLNNEAFWPHRVTRAPLTDADRARGYTAGAITVFDTRAESSASVKIDTVDARFEWVLSLGEGRVRLYGDATYYLRNVQTAPFQADLDRVDHLGGPLERRGNVGAVWATGPVSLGLNVQHLGSYRIYPAGAVSLAIDSATRLQGSERVPAQTYVDLHATWRRTLHWGARLQDIAVDVGVVNVLDQAPPRESSYSHAQFFGLRTPAAPGYSRYGDPRQRRMVVTLSAAF